MHTLFFDNYIIPTGIGITVIEIYIILFINPTKLRYSLNSYYKIFLFILGFCSKIKLMPT